MSEITTIGLDLAKHVFQLHGADASGRAVLHKKLRRHQVLVFFSQLEPCVVAMEACGGAQFWGREIGRLGHEVRLIPPAYVKPFAKRQKKNDASPMIAQPVNLALRESPPDAADQISRQPVLGSGVVQSLPDREHRQKPRRTRNRASSRSTAA